MQIREQIFFSRNILFQFNDGEWCDILGNTIFAYSLGINELIFSTNGQNKITNSTFDGVFLSVVM